MSNIVPPPATDKSEAPGVPTRRAALRLLDAVLRRGLPLEAALGSATRELPRPDDRAHAHALAAETLRRLPDLDALIDSATAKRLPDDAKARGALRLALAQTLAMGTPPHAAIATVLPLVDGGPRRLVHGVFGTLMRGQAALPAVPRLPDGVAKRWSAAWGDGVAEAAGRLFAVPPPLDLTVARPPAPSGESLMPGHVRLVSGHDPVPQLPGFAEGGWWVQDIAASLPARLLGTGRGRAIDLCAAPGGKTLQLAAAGWDVTAVDFSRERLARVRDNLRRTGLSATLAEGDALTFAAEPAGAVLLDAPCSATGIFRRHPDVLHRARPNAIARLAEQQRALLARAATLVAPGGTLVYAVCSLEPAEGEANADHFLATQTGFEAVPVRADELPTGITPDANGRLRVLPGMLEAAGGADGFFAARFRRKA